jgi:transposase
MHKKQLDIIQVVERRRKWPTEAKARIMEEARAPGATVASVADRYSVSRSQVYGWLRKTSAASYP